MKLTSVGLGLSRCLPVTDAAADSALIKPSGEKRRKRTTGIRANPVFAISSGKDGKGEGE